MKLPGNGAPTLTGARLQGAAPLGGKFGDGRGTSRLRRRMRTGRKSRPSSAITPRPIRMSGRTLASGLAPVFDESPALCAGVGALTGPRPVPAPCVAAGIAPLVGDAPGEAATVGDILAPTVTAVVGDGKTLSVALGEGAGVVVGTVGYGYTVLVTVGEGVFVTVGEGVEVTVGEGVLVSVGVTSSGV